MTAPFCAFRAKAVGWGYLSTSDRSQDSDIPQASGSIRQTHSSNDVQNGLVNLT